MPTTTTSSSGPSPSSIKIRTLSDRARLAEFIVEKRSKFLLYLVQLHAPRQKASAAVATPPLWMGTVRIHRAEILRHFLVPEELVREEAVVRPISSSTTTDAPSSGPTSTILAPPLTLGSRAQTNLSRPPQVGAGGPSSPITSMPSEPYSMDASKAAGTPQYPVAEASWVREHCTRWALIGACLPGILQAPLYSPPDAFIDAFYQLLLEIDVYLEGTDTAAKLLSIRTLKSYRSDRFDRLKKSQGAVACYDASLKLSKAKGGGGGGDAMGSGATDAQEAVLQTDTNGGNAPVLQMMSRRYECQAHAATRGILRHVRSKASGHTLPYPVGCQPDAGSATQPLSVVEMVEEEQHQAYNQKVIDALMGGTADNAIPLAAFHSSLPQRKHVLLAMGLGAGGLPTPVFTGGGGGGGGGVNSSKADGDASKAAGEEWDKALEGVEGSYLESKGSFKYHFLDVEVAKSIVGGGGPFSSGGGSGNGNGGGGPDSSPKRPPKKDGGGGEGGHHSDPWADMPSASGKGPSYDVVTPALCKVLTTAYNKLADYSALEEPHAVETILAIDKRLKHDFFGALSRQLGTLAQAKLQQQALYLTDGIFGSYSSAGREIGAWLPQGDGMGGLLMGGDDED